ncbi:lipid II flippase Amj family protein [Paenibacillus pini]|uniref:Lipid II flippase Amj n=1 Tax=Paenibacillus pini JCM 16418 TaxID=1236976 RepID=W7YRK3_9BACL|nr:lipid II flippase Amj family protein [Paenibacillus pini]GAF07221.1 membrane protein [Paenibacillus pini JCM 16418]
MIQFAMIIAFTMVIHTVDSLSYAIRLGGLRSRRITLALSLAGLLVLISRTSNIAQGPMVGHMVDGALKTSGFHLEFKLHMILVAATLGTLIAMVLFPSMVRLCSRMVVHLEAAGSIPKMLKNSANKRLLKNALTYIKWPNLQMFKTLFTGRLPRRLMVLNMVVTAIYTVGVLSALYAAYLWPADRLSASTSSGLINGLATILLTLLIDPRIALLSDRTLRGQAKLGQMNQVFGLMMVSRCMGTMMAQLLLVPCAYWIGWMVAS